MATLSVPHCILLVMHRSNLLFPMSLYSDIYVVCKCAVFFSLTVSVLLCLLHRRTSYFLPAGNIGRTYEVIIIILTYILFLHMNSMNLSWEELMKHVTRNKAVLVILKAEDINDTILVIYRVGICPFIVIKCDVTDTLLSHGAAPYN